MQKVKHVGIALGDALLIVFVVMKLAGIGAVAAWGWWWVLSPLWIPLALVAVLLLFAWVCYVLDDHMTMRKSRKKAKRHG